ncbi:hypothetical protein Glove_346g176 [Diversispora epigaea]|uniref:Uncharacterized protein n=1 Tax=Diversispora epigaea TaxID=1348612 RepID=A0A397HF34_9GLOM|nr:hypothetical protein Glove_346g176 [Diversispora epigaea]
MWCDNCLLLFPLRAGAICLGLLMAIFQIVGGALLFKYGDFFFFHTGESSIYGGFAFLQAALALIAVAAFSTRSETFANFNLRVYPVVIILGIVRGIIMAWSVDHYKGRITQECNNGGQRWIDPSIPVTFTHNSTTGGYDKVEDDTRLPDSFCDNNLKTLTALFSLSLIIDFILMCYFYFMIWRFVVKLQHYPFQGKYSY